ncbi:MAG: Xaa-Pro aminopeptidase [Candidatus Mesenet longicola]|uniref:Xaa-Pro aminopeptidase n=1 Tax=Candidatus Mesenet longicola TaxID=1892558 RepID=A0A8J3MNS8_9RICK|nr:MAG: Xaa-Pro aminopeptidase [Candidatus Mesenet longicola]GHM59268.1 MAG: Xaa-Pro aminopeptidase [Candidatus Mesenet longicola]
MIEKLNNLMKKAQADAFLLHNKDEYFSDYPHESKQRLKWLCGFTGTNGTVIVTKEGKSPFFTDGRYTLQASYEIDLNIYEIFDISKKTPWQWAKENLQQNSTLAYPISLFTLNQIRKYEGVCVLKPLDDNPIDGLWNRPLATKQKVINYPLQYSGKSSKQKCLDVAKTINKQDAVLLTNSESISWLLNIRNNNFLYNPVVLSYAILYGDGHVDLFTEDSSFEFELDEHVNTLDINSLSNVLNKIDLIITDPETVPMRIMKLLDGKSIMEAKDLCALPKAIKNATEIQGAINAHIRDGAAVTNFLNWLEANIDKGVTELEAEEKLLEFRQKQSLFKSLSFPTISAFAENGAVIHYRTNKKTNKRIEKNGLYLIDSGGQYLDGTTDVTRTITIGIPSSVQIDNYTRVLKAHIEVARAIFPSGTTGRELDILARMHLWQAGLDYSHSTGHGVGSYLAVHEGPHAIAKGNNIPLQPGMILSNEPGYYKPGEYGIRIENLMYVEEKKEGFLGFKQLTCVPYDKRLINYNLLTQDEINWINEYHSFVDKTIQKIT